MKAKQEASKRTKNRIAEHAKHGLTEQDRDTFGNLFDGEKCVLFSCECGWLGWLPEKELEKII
jgi:hypothetical protein